MQSQQKKVKWSRGETADALEERTDTGITTVSVSKMENIISDVYGNISRRPAFKLIDSATGATDLPVITTDATADSNSAFIRQPQSFVFTIDADTYIIFIAGSSGNGFGGLLIHNNKFVRRITITNNTTLSLVPVWYESISVAQYNNFMIVSNLSIADVIFRLSGTQLSNYGISVELFQFSAPWIAPNGTQTMQVTSSEVTGLNFDASSIGQYTYTESNGETTVYSWIKTGINHSAITGIWSGATTTYYAHVSNNDLWIDTSPTGGLATSSITMTKGTTYTSGQTVGTGPDALGFPIVLYIREHSAELIYAAYYPYDVSQNMSITPPAITNYIPVGSIVQFPNNGAYMRVEGYDSDGTNLRMYGPFLTPVADDTAHDTIVKVETGYISLQKYQPKKFTFFNQRLYASAFTNTSLSPKTIPGYAVGSQIGRYTDFKNSYNAQNEAVQIDISTAFQEQIVGMVDYNGLKLFTDSAEYAYTNSGVIKQSENGSLALCKPLVFGSVCLYADKSGGQIRALQYEMQSDLFNSSTINQMTQEDLIFNTVSMAGFIDKEHYAGHFLYAIQQGYTEAGVDWGDPKAIHDIAVCNMVPGNQALIWSRWISPDIKIGNYKRHSISNVIEINNKVWFIVDCVNMLNGNPYVAYTLAELSYDNLLDFEISQSSTATAFSLSPQLHPHNLYAWVDRGNTVYTMTENVMQGDPIYNSLEQQISTAENSPGGPNIVIDGIGYYAWQPVGTGLAIYTKEAIPAPTGPNDDPSRQLFDVNGDLISNKWITGYNTQWNQMMVGTSLIPGIQVIAYERIYSASTLQYTVSGITYNGTYTSAQNIYVENMTIPGIISVFDGDKFMWNDTIGMDGSYSRSLSELTNPRVGFMINATLESHPLDIQGKTYTEKKRIGKAVAVIRDTEPDAFTVCDKTGYTSPDKKTVNFYGCTGMKDQIRYTIKNKKGAKFTIESLTMIIEYGTLDS